ncbi:PREDICTED: uncharacterized protein LOC108779184 [Cyphomyrmex costatus]|uniref:uncharacterized protein LOC108779184 n=1 Tax=Cyphomyrmex costatus TaxID=456900 RepID=UPI0008522EB2|nr:PREDICTED: uncharacterized protein LOC108779184 [Cyphomyrmex costatus]
MMISIDGVEIPIADHLKYLGVIVDSRWSFVKHFQMIGERLTKTVNKLSRILPNIGGPSSLVRRLHSTVVDSIALYAAPTWINQVERNKTILRILDRVQRRIACRVIRGYRTVSLYTATLLAGSTPFIIRAAMYTEVYEDVKDLRAGGMKEIPPNIMNKVRLKAKRNMLRAWKDWTNRPGHAGGQVGQAIRPVLGQWMNEKIGLSYHATQLLTGHGCFGQYLYRIRKETSSACWFCPDRLDSADHTLCECPAWDRERAELKAIVGNDLSIPTLIMALLEKEKRSAFLCFGDKVMSVKEEKERESAIK